MHTQSTCFVRSGPVLRVIVLSLSITALVGAQGIGVPKARADAGGPYVVEPGGSVQLVGSASVPGDEANAANLRAIGLALHNYESANSTLPPSYSTDNSGLPLLSWRVLILRFFGAEGADLYARFDLGKPWDDPANLPLLRMIPDVYRDPRGSRRATHTRYSGVAGPNQVFQGAYGVGFRDIVDGTSNTLMVGEVGRRVRIPWTAPGDVEIENHPVLGNRASFAGRRGKLTPFVFADGAVRYLFDANSTATVTALSTIDGDDTVDLNEASYTVVFAWDLDGDRVFETKQQSPFFSAAGLGVGRTGVFLRVTDNFGRVSRSRARIFIRRTP